MTKVNSAKNATISLLARKKMFYVSVLGTVGGCFYLKRGYYAHFQALSFLSDQNPCTLESPSIVDRPLSNTFPATVSI